MLVFPQQFRIAKPLKKVKHVGSLGLAILFAFGSQKLSRPWANDSSVFRRVHTTSSLLSTCSRSAAPICTSVLYKKRLRCFINGCRLPIYRDVLLPGRWQTLCPVYAHDVRAKHQIPFRHMSLQDPVPSDERVLLLNCAHCMHNNDDDEDEDEIALASAAESFAHMSWR